MKAILLSGLFLATAFRVVAADGTVNFTNYDSNNPIFYLNTNTRLPMAGSFVQVLGGPLGGELQVLKHFLGVSTFLLSEPGFFDAGFGIIPGVGENSVGAFQVRAWRNAPSWESASERGQSIIYEQPTGTNQPVPDIPFPAQNLMPSFIVSIIPEPHMTGLLLLGAAALLFRRKP